MEFQRPLVFFLEKNKLAQELLELETWKKEDSENHRTYG